MPKGNLLRNAYLFAIGTILGLSAFAQAHSQAAMLAVPDPAFQVIVTSRTVQAVNYGHRNGATDLAFAATSLMPSAEGRAKVRTKRGTMEVEAEFGLQSPAVFGAEYLTYVLWAISPEGRAVNLGELLIGGNDRSKLTATTDLQAFALIVTAEPYFAVREPSNVVVLQNVVTAETKGTSEAVNIKYELIERGSYLPTGYKFDPVVLNAGLPLEFYEARNALRIARSEGAEKYAGESYGHAAESMKAAEDEAIGKHGDTKSLIASARQTVQTAEESREIAVKRIEEDRLLAERQAASDAQASTQAQADNANRQKRMAEMDAAMAQANEAAAQVNAAAAQANAAKAQSEMATNQAASAAAVNAANADAAQSRLVAEQAQQSENRAVSEKVALRAQLIVQLNKILETRDSARGLIVSMSDVLFNSGKYTLMPGAREKLAKVAGILLAYPSLDIAVGGYTDNVGGDTMNQTLSENRAGSVRDYLVQEGVTSTSVSAKGYGNSMPVASNDSSAGRQENRRVELVVSGDAIGSTANVTTGSL
jgi:outer membrane protein OmpA-like peptidoglycan-associated protein